MAVLALEVERGWRRATGLVRHEDAAGVQALQAGSILRRQRAADHGAALVGAVAGAGVGAAGQFARNETAGMSFFGGDAARRGIDGAGQAADPAVEVIPAQHVRGGVARLVVFGPGQVELAEHPAFIVGLLEQFRRGHVIRRNLGVGDVVRADRLIDLGPERIAAKEEGGAPRGTFGHRPGIAETHARGRDRRRCSASSARWRRRSRRMPSGRCRRRP